MKQLKSFFAMSVLCLSSLACNTFSKQQCLEMNWSAAGQKAALDGKTLSQGEAYYQNECRAKHSVETDQQLFKFGFENGLKEFCSPQYSYAFGMRGGQYQGTCPKEQEAQIVDRFQNGRIVFLEKRISQLEGENSSLQSEVRSLESKVSSLESQVNRTCP